MDKKTGKQNNPNTTGPGPEEHRGDLDGRELQGRRGRTRVHPARRAAILGATQRTPPPENTFDIFDTFPLQ